MFGENCLRVLLTAFNFIFAILSLALIALAILYEEKLLSVTLYIEDIFITFPTLLLILGSLSFVFSILGCYCTRTAHKGIFMVFLIALSCLLALELSISVIAFLNINSELANNTKSLMEGQVTSTSANDIAKFHKIEELFQCCGITDPEDYLDNSWPSLNFVYCCGIRNCRDELENNYYSQIWHKYGCADVVAVHIKKIIGQIAAIGTVFSTLQTLEMICVAVMQRQLT
ncbi:hypothetical protein RI129_006000 [Pyrocoelia pectoralis]|uniref:Tetraspanin n=1 Tax=Pyrocoelia pectoralis TaxID=417401 RepID=A0AAN7VAF3_9COLE